MKCRKLEQHNKYVEKEYELDFKNNRLKKENQVRFATFRKQGGG